MFSLRSDGFAHLLQRTAAAARSAPDSRQALRVTLTLDGRIPEDIGRTALSAPDRHLLDTLCQPGVRLGTPDGAGDLLALDPTGRTRFVQAGEALPDGALPVGSFTGDALLPGALRRRAEDRESASAEWEELREWLLGMPPETITETLDRISHVVLHMAPVMLYVGDRYFSNFGKFSNLPGRSMAVTAPRNILGGLAALPVTEWAPEEACFVALVLVALHSGTQSRLEEFNSTQLVPAPVEEFLTDRIRGYGARPPDVAGLPLGPRLETLARYCAERRADHLARGTVFYRLIHGTNLNKREILLRPPVGYADVPRAVRDFLSDSCGIPATTAAVRDTAPALETLARDLRDRPAPDGFSSGYEALLTGFMTAMANATASDVAMGRGPRSMAPLHPDSTGPDDPLSLRTSDFFCCVAPGTGLEEAFGADRAGLVKALSAYSARMRFNTWHYLPHTLGISDRVPGRDDWFFAPSMPDLTHWSDQHHTGHVAFGVRFAIRVPLGIHYAGRFLPGLYDLRLMRALGEPYTTVDLRAAVAAGQVLAAIHQAMSVHDPVVRDFGNDWFRACYG